MSYEWDQSAFRADRPVRAPSGLSQSLAKALFGAAISSLPGAAFASEETGTPTVATGVPATGVPAATAALTGPVIATAAVPSMVPIADVAAGPPATTPIALPVAASAEQRSYGPLRPGLGTPANTMAPGQVSIETGFLDWQRDDTDGIRSDTLLVGETTVRVGVTPSIEVMAGWTPFGHVRVRDDTGTVEQANRVGDAIIGFKTNLAHPDGSGLSAAVQPFVVLPVGRAPVGVGDWGAGVVAPISYDLSKTVNVPEDISFEAFQAEWTPPPTAPARDGIPATASSVGSASRYRPRSR